MKALSLEIKNIGLVESLSLSLDKPLILFYGDIQEGKTTILNAVRWCFGGSFPDDIIRHGAEEASVKLTLSNGFVTRSWYRARDGTTKARAVEYMRDGQRVINPADAIKELLNPYLLDQNFLVNKNELGRKKYFAELFAVNDANEDSKIAQLENEAQQLRAKISGYGEIVVVPANPGDTVSIQKQIDAAKTTWAEIIAVRHKALADIRARNELAYSLATKTNSDIAIRNREYDERVNVKIPALSREVDSLTEKLKAANDALNAAHLWVRDNPRQQESAMPQLEATAPLEQSLSEQSPKLPELQALLAKAAADDVRYEQHIKDKARSDEKVADQSVLRNTEASIKTLRDARITRLKNISETCGIPGLVFDEFGNFFYLGTEAGMLSTSQLMELSSALSRKYPKGFGLELIDRAESLGTSIFKFTDRAKAEEKTILATIVGERPAKVPEDIGVFVVESGKVS